MIILINLEPLHAGRHAINIANYINNSLDMARKYARIFVRGHYLFREAKLFPRGKLEENYELRGTAKGKYPGIFSKSNGAYCAYHYPSNFFFSVYAKSASLSITSKFVSWLPTSFNIHLDAFEQTPLQLKEKKRKHTFL